MLTVNVHDAKAKLSHYLDLAQKGKTLIIAKRNIPVAQISPIEKAKVHRQLGLSKQKFEVPNSFFEPLPKQVIDSFASTR